MKACSRCNNYSAYRLLGGICMDCIPKAPSYSPVAANTTGTTPTEPCIKVTIGVDRAEPTLTFDKPKITGFNCSCCNSRNDYAESNQANGTYLCYECR